MKPSSDKPKHVERHIKSSSICGRCLYNVPEGTAICLFPGIIILILGIVILAWTSSVSSANSWDNKAQIGIICVAIGGVFFLVGLGYWAYGWCTVARSVPKKHTISPVRLPRNEPIQLVSITSVRERPRDLQQNGQPKKKKITADELASRLEERARKKAQAAKNVESTSSQQGKSPKNGTSQPTKSSSNNIDSNPTGQINKGFNFYPEKDTCIITLASPRISYL